MKSLSILTILLISLNLTSCSIILNHDDYCAENEPIIRNKVTIYKIPEELEYIKKHNLPVWVSDICIANNTKEIIILHEIWQFRGETTRSYFLCYNGS